ncbi:MAG: hypothetical protein FWG14_07120 [Peptococcaceae bacterium]|nr:hypothetical protein [Peptococcaceae bacterium]
MEKVVFDVPGLMKAYSRSSDRSNVFLTCKNLILFSREKGLFVDGFLEDVAEISPTLIVKERDLTDAGKQVFKDLMYDWLGYTDNEDGKVDRANNIKMLEKYYKNIIKYLEQEQ